MAKALLHLQALIRDSGRVQDLWIGDVGSNVTWLRWLGTDQHGRPSYDSKKLKSPINGGFFRADCR